MLRFAPWALLAFTPLAQAQFEWLHARGHNQECCPCPTPGAQDDNVKTVTVTEPAGTAHTVTVTLPHEGYSQHTVYITETEHQTTTHTVTSYPDPPSQPPSKGGDKTVTVTNGSPAPTDVVPEGNGNDVYTKTVVVGHNGSRKVVTVTVGNNDNYEVETETSPCPEDSETVQTVTISNPNGSDTVETITISNNNYNQDRTVTVGYPQPTNFVKTISYGNNKYKTVTIDYSRGEDKTVTVDLGNGKYETVTVGYNDDNEKTVTVDYNNNNNNNNNKDKTATIGYPQITNTAQTVTIDSNDRTETKTIYEGDDCYTVIVTPTPCTTTITLDNGDKTTKVYEEPHTITVTSPPETATETVKEYRTITNTVTDSNGSTDVEIIIIDIYTGKSTCKKKESGLPCSNNYQSLVTYSQKAPASKTSCPPVAVSTSTSTVYNTVVVTVGPEATGSASATGTRSLRARRPRAPLSVRRW